MRKLTHQTFPDFIKCLPKADIAIKGINAWIAQGAKFQLVFFEVQPGVSIPPHNHEAQFGMIIEGELSLTIEGKTNRYKRGDSYFIPAGATHQGVFHTFTRVMDFFDEPDRYQVIE